MSFLNVTTVLAALLGGGPGGADLKVAADARASDGPAHVIQVKKGYFRRDQGYDHAYYAQRSRVQGNGTSAQNGQQPQSGGAGDVIIYYDGGQHNPGLRDNPMADDSQTFISR